MKIIAIGGFLGSGKTTLLLRLAKALRAGGVERLAIIENEAGKVGIDDGLVRDAGLDVREIFGGCVCCSMGANLLLTLKQLEEQCEPEVVIVEASGVASPDMIPRVLEGYDKPLEAVRVVVVFDAERFEALSRVARPMVEASAAAAEAVVLNKVDLVDREAVVDMVDRLHQLQPGLAIVPMAAHEGRGLDRLLKSLGAGRAASGEAAGSGSESGSGSADEDHDHDDHAHAGEPIAEARQLRVEAAGEPIDGLRLVRAVSDALQRITRGIADHEEAVVGHVKASATAGSGERAIVRQTSAKREPEVVGALPESMQEATLIVNALAYAMARPPLGALVDEALAGLSDELDASVHPVRT